MWVESVGRTKRSAVPAIARHVPTPKSNIEITLRSWRENDHDLRAY